MRQAELKEIAETAHYQMRLLETARNRLRKEQNMSYDVSIKAIPERYAATVHMTIPRYEDEGMVWQILNEETGPLNVIPAEPCLVAAEYLDDEYKEEDVELIAWKTVRGKYPDTEHVKFKTLPAVKVASCMVKGGYDQMPEVYGAVIAWVNENGYEYAGPMFNIYHVSPHETQNPDEFVTEVCYAVR
jgi:effector-binding domain-containing protein